MQLISTLLFLLPAVTFAAPLDERQNVAVDFQALTALRSKVIQVNEQFAITGNSLRSDFIAIRSSWSGNAANNANAAISEFDAGLAQVRSALGKLDSALSTVANNYQQTEEKNTGRWGKE